MIKVNGSFEKIKAEMKLHKQAAEQELRHLKKEAKKRHVNLEAAGKKREMYLQSKTTPVRIEGLIVNYKLLQAFLKKIKRFQAEISIGEDYLQLDYKTDAATSGQLIIYDLSRYFADFKHVPGAEIERVGGLNAY